MIKITNHIHEIILQRKESEREQYRACRLGIYYLSNTQNELVIWIWPVGLCRLAGKKLKHLVRSQSIVTRQTGLLARFVRLSAAQSFKDGVFSVVLRNRNRIDVRACFGAFRCVFSPVFLFYFRFTGRREDTRCHRVVQLNMC